MAKKWHMLAHNISLPMSFTHKKLLIENPDQKNTESK